MLKADHAGRSAAARARPVLRRFGANASRQARRVWQWLLPILHSILRWVLNSAQRVRQWAQPRLQRLYAWAAPRLRRLQEWTALHVRRARDRAAPHARRAHDWVSLHARRARDWAAPYARRARDRAAPYLRRLRERAEPVVRPVQQRLAPVIAAIRARLPQPDTARHRRVPARMRSVQVGTAVAAFGVLAIVFGVAVPNSENRDTEPVAHSQELVAPEPVPMAPKDAPAAPEPKTLSGDDQEKPAVHIGPNAVGVDVSNYQGTVDWNAVAASGKEYAFVLATDGMSFTNPLFQQQYNGAKQAGLLVSAYHFGRPTGSAVAQANRLMDTMGSTAGDRTLPPVLDLEVSPSSGGCYGKSVGQMHTWVQTFLDTIKARTGDEAIIYASPSFWSQCMGGSDAFSDNPLWIAEYGVSQPTVPGGWEHYTFWQYTAKGSVPGISGPTDINRFLGSGEELLELAD